MAGTAPDIRIFISYRRDDAGPFCGSIYRHLKSHFGAEDRVFRDVDSIEPGRPWDYAIDDAVGSCDVFLVLIGPGWLTATDDEGKRRLDDDEDRHRREIEVALDRKIRLFPVLLEDAKMPPKEALPASIRGLQRIQGWRIRDDETFEWGVAQLIALIEKAAERDADRRRAAEADKRETADREQGVRDLVSRAKEQAEAGDTGDALATLDLAGVAAREIQDAARREEVYALVKAADLELRSRPEAAERDSRAADQQSVGSSGTTRRGDTNAAKEPGQPERGEGAREFDSAGPQASLNDREAAALSAADNAALITTVAGTGRQGFSGDGGRATDAQLSSASFAASADGGLLIADTFSHRVRRVGPDGRISTVAGTGTEGFAGDGGAAIEAQLCFPEGVAATLDGGFLIADCSHRVRRVGPDGTISTVAGTGTEGLGGGRGAATEAQLRSPACVAATADGGFLVADRSHRVHRVGPDGTITTVAGTGTEGFSGDGGPAGEAQLYSPLGVAPMHDGGFLIADAFNHRVRRVAPDGTITTVAGIGTQGFSGDGGPASEAQLWSPGAVAATPDGGFLIADHSNHRVRRVGPDGTISTVAGTGTEGIGGDGGPAAEAQLRYPRGVAMTHDGGLLIADMYRVRRVSGVFPSSPPPRPAPAPGDPARAAVVMTVAGTGTAGFAGDGGPATEAQLDHAQSVAATSDGGFLIADWYNHRVRRVAPDGTIATVAGTGAEGLAGDGGPATEAQLNHPLDVAAAPEGGFLVVDANQRVRRVAPDGTITTVAGSGMLGFFGDGGSAIEAHLNNPIGVAAAKEGGFLIADTHNHRVRCVAPDGTITTVAGSGTAGFSGDGGPATAARLWFPHRVVASADGGFLIADTFNNRVRRVTPDGTISTAAGTGTEGSAADGGPATEAELRNPSAIAATPDGGFLIADLHNHRVRRVAPDGTINTVAGSGAEGPAGEAILTNPVGVAVTPDGNLLIADDHRVWRVSGVLPPRPARQATPAPVAPARAGIITTVAGTGESGFSGDGGAATAAQLYYPFGVAAGGDGGFLIVDMGNDRVRRVVPDGTITTVAGTGWKGFSGDGGPATEAGLNYPRGAAATPDGGLLIADTDNQRVRRVAPDGTITTVAGTGWSGLGGEGGLATEDELWDPFGVGPTPDGGFLVADASNHRVRRVAADGTVRTLAGVGEEGFSGDGGPATEAQLSRPSAVVASPDGGCLIADTGNHRVRRVATDGTITTVAGTGEWDFSGDGGPATEAQLSALGVAWTADGGFLIADANNERVRLVAPDGTISTVAGAGASGFTGRGPATSARLAGPTGVAATPDGGVLIAESGTNRVRLVSGGDAAASSS